MKNQVQYASWVSMRPILKGAAATALLGMLTAVSHFLWHAPAVWLIPALCVTAAFLSFTVYLSLAKTALSYRGGKAQSKVLDSVVTRLDGLSVNKEGSLLDIGCGSGAMSVKAAKKFPKLCVTGIDFWGKDWYYSQEQCERNATLEGVASRVRFERADAAKLPYADDAFDAAISNLVFHEVRTQPDKPALIKEALRVVKPGGAFVFQDVFYAAHIYGSIETLLELLKPCVKELHFADSRHLDGVPAFLNTRFVIGRLGVIYGIK